MRVQTAPVCAWRGIIDLVADVLTGVTVCRCNTTACTQKQPCGLHLLSSDEGEGNGDSFGGDSLKKKKENLV